MKNVLIAAVVAMVMTACGDISKEVASVVKDCPQTKYDFYYLPDVAKEVQSLEIEWADKVEDGYWTDYGSLGGDDMYFDVYNPDGCLIVSIELREEV